MTGSSAGADHQRGGSRRRSVARLTAVQALYQLEANPEAEPEAVIREFIRHRFGREIDGDQLGEADPVLFADIVLRTAADRERLDTEISAALTPDWPLARLDSVLRAILRAGAFEPTRSLPAGSPPSPMASSTDWGVRSARRSFNRDGPGSSQ